MLVGGSTTTGGGSVGVKPAAGDTVLDRTMSAISSSAGAMSGMSKSSIGALEGRAMGPVPSARCSSPRNGPNKTPS